MEPKKIQEDIKKSFPIISQGMNKGFDFTQQHNPELADLLRQIFAILMKPLVALRAKFYRIILKPFKKLEQSKIPVFRIGIILLGFAFINGRDVSFAFSMGNPIALATSSNSQTISQSEDDKGYAVSVNEYAPVGAKDLKESTAEEYIKRYKELAITEMKKYGIPASITLGQALIESRAGNSRLARENKNHFGVKCFSKNCAKGHCTNHLDDHHKDFFRKYESVWGSYRNHSEFLQRGRYSDLKNHGKNYKKWAAGLKKAGYATDKKYDKKLISVIERHKLYKYDK